MRHIFFIQSLTGIEIETGKIIYDRLKYSSYSEKCQLYPPICVNSLDGLVCFLKRIITAIPKEDHLVIHVDIHSNDIYVTFKEITSMVKESYTEYCKWDCLTAILNSLFEKYNQNILVIFASCSSSSFFSTMKSPHIYIIAGEGGLLTIDAGHYLIDFYDYYCENGDVEKAYEKMIEKHPIEDEMKKEENKRAIFKLFK